MIDCFGFFSKYNFTPEICIIWMIFSQIFNFVKLDQRFLLCFPGYKKSIAETEQADGEKSVDRTCVRIVL